MVIPSSCALSNLEPAASPATTKSVLLDTEADAFPPREVIASVISSLLKSLRDPVTTIVNPVRVCLIFAFGASTKATPAFSHFFIICLCQSISNHSTIASAITSPTPSISANSCALAFWIFDIDPNLYFLNLLYCLHLSILHHPTLLLLSR